MIMIALALLSAHAPAPATSAVIDVASVEPSSGRLPPVVPRPARPRVGSPYGQMNPKVLEMLEQLNQDPQFADMDANGDGVVDRVEHAEWRRRSAEDASFRLLGYRKSDRGAPCDALRSLPGSVPQPR